MLEKLKKALSQSKTKAFWKAAGIRAGRTFLQSTLGAIAGVTVAQVDWKYALGIGVSSALISLGHSVLSVLPEVTQE